MHGSHTTSLTLSRPWVIENSMPANQNRLAFLLIFSAVDGLKLKNLMAFA